MREIDQMRCMDPSSGTGQAIVSSHSVPLSWRAGVRYTVGAELWCAFRNGEATWTTGPRLAATFPTDSAAAMATRQLADDDTVPFWQEEYI